MASSGNVLDGGGDGPSDGPDTKRGKKD